MSAKTTKRVIEIIRPLFPEHAEIRAPNFQCIIIDWKLNNDKNRLNKPSKTINIILTDEFREDYDDGDEQTKDHMEKKLFSQIARNLDDFDPDHDTPYLTVPPSVEWIIQS